MTNGLAQRKVAIVTGGAQGIGKAIALRLAKDGHHVGLNDLPSKKAVLEDVAHQVEQHGVRAGVFTGDVTKENDVRATIDGAADLADFSTNRRPSKQTYAQAAMRRCPASRQARRGQ